MVGELEMGVWEYGRLASVTRACCVGRYLPTLCFALAVVGRYKRGVDEHLASTFQHSQGYSGCAHNRRCTRVGPEPGATGVSASAAYVVQASRQLDT